MGVITEFHACMGKRKMEKEKKQKAAWEAFQKTVETDPECHTMKTASAVLAAGGEYTGTLAKDPEVCACAEQPCASWQQKFMEKYGGLVAGAPDMPVPRIQYFAGIMQQMIPQMKDAMENNGDLEREFTDLYFTCISDAVSLWCSADKEISDMLDHMHAALCMQHSEPESGVADAEIALAYILSVRVGSADASQRILLGYILLFHACMGILGF